jgi:hypothetical protein
MCKKTFRNQKTGEVVTTELSLAELAKQFSEGAPEGHWAWYWLAKFVEERKGASQTLADMRAFLADSFLYAIGMGLKKPMIRLSYKDRRYKVYLSARGTVCFKSGALVPGTSDPMGDEEYMGCVFNGRFLVNRDRRLLAVEEEFLKRLETDPVGFMAQASKDMNRCCYCNLPLEDQRSKDVGYGAVCAARWGLPWGKEYDEKVPSFAQLWGRADNVRDIRAMCDAIRKDPHNEVLWAILGDALEEAGFTKRPSAPARGVTIPSA